MRPEPSDVQLLEPDPQDHPSGSFQKPRKVLMASFVLFFSWSQRSPLGFQPFSKTQTWPSAPWARESLLNHKEALPMVSTLQSLSSNRLDMKHI